MSKKKPTQKNRQQSLLQPWWKETTVYQVYPRSFKDSRGDGIGDLEGVISRVDYLQELGIETIWLSPFYTSPQQDIGYDISHYCNVSPEYGTLEIFDRLLFEVHKRKMKLVLDMVLNHTSIQHPWFRESASDCENPKRNWYVWRDGRKPDGKAPPNNWRSMVGGSGWHYHRESRQWYWASFLPFQPDLNYRNPEVKQEMFKVLRFWLDRGVDGFRLDIIGAVYEDPFFRDNPFTWKLLPDEENTGFLFRSHRMTQNHPDNFEFARELRAVVDEYSSPGGPSPENPYSEKVLIGETFGSPEVLRRYCGQEQPDALHLVFLFKTMVVPFSAPAFRKLVEEFEQIFPAPFIPTYVYSNHDRFRRFSVLGEDTRKAKLNSLFQLTVRGVPFIYYGEEIGMRQGRINPKNTRDAVARHIGTFPAAKIKFLNRLTNGAIQRDGCRTPMQWDSSLQAGFTQPTVEPWMPVNENFKKVNAAEQKGRGDSLYTCYQQLLKLRHRYPALHRGSLELLPKGLLPKAVLGYTRSTPEGEKLLMLLNFSRKIQRFSLPRPISNSASNSEAEVQILYSTVDSRVQKRPFASPGELQPYEGLLLIKLCPDQGPSASGPA